MNEPHYIIAKIVVVMGLVLSIVTINLNASINLYEFDYKLISLWKESYKWTEMSKDTSHTILSIEGIPLNAHTIEVCGKMIDIGEKLVYSMYVKCIPKYTEKGQLVIKFFSSDENYFSARLEKINSNSGRVQVTFASPHQIKNFVPFKIESDFPEYSLFME